jgi:hypothetical protein
MRVKVFLTKDHLFLFTFHIPQPPQYWSYDIHICTYIHTYIYGKEQTTRGSEGEGSSRIPQCQSPHGKVVRLRP